MAPSDAVIAATRFGLGARPGDLQEIGTDPRGWLEAQLVGEPAPTPHLTGRPASPQIVADFLGRRGQMSPDDRKAQREAHRELYIEEVVARTITRITSPMPFRERLVAFWSNHFAVSIARREILAIAGAFEREAIRPRVTGSFSEMLLASTRHPAMLVYLDNVRSVGPDSMAGKRRGLGLNENLAREILELHTLGVNGGYVQQDVEALARLLTGWTLARSGSQIGQFAFDPARHQPGAVVLLGYRYPGLGQLDGAAALEDLAKHPATARFVAEKLVRHFVADDPPSSAVDRVEAAFRDSDGDLAETGKALIHCPEAWGHGAKFKTPDDLVTSVGRAIRWDTLDRDPRLLAQSLRILGQLPWGPPSPQGWPDRAEDWLASEALLTRLEWCERVAERVGALVPDVEALAADVLGPLISDATRTAIGRSPNNARALALLLASPAFQRR